MRNKRDRSARTRSGFAIAAACAAFAFCAGRAHAQSGAALQAQLIREYVDTFSPHGMVAVLIPIGQQAGDVLDKLGEELVHRRQECFANLAPQESPSSLPNFDLGASAAFRLGLGLDKIADADLKAVGENRVILRFEDVTVQTISQGEFRQTIDRKACPEIGRLVDKNPDALKDGTLLVGELFRARVIVRLDRTRDDSAKVSTGWLTGIAQRFGLRVKAEAGGDLATAQSIELSSSKEPVAVAFRPAFIRLDPTQPGFKATEGRPDAPSIVPFNSESEDDRLALNALIVRQLPRVAGPP